MKSVIKFISTGLLLFITGWNMQSCSDENYTDAMAEKKDLQIPLKIETAANSGDFPELNYSLYVFKKSASMSDYLLSEQIPSIQQGITYFKVSSQEMQTNDYRFLFIATPQATAEIKVKEISNSSLQENETIWSDLIISQETSKLSQENYYGITDMSGSEIRTAETIHGKLKRIVGQMIFDFFKADTNVNNPVDTDAAYGSVLDRIKSVEIHYSGLTRSLSFDMGKELQINEIVSQEYIESFPLGMDDLFQVILPQPDAGLENAGMVKGGVRMKGLFLLPSTQGIKIKIIFHYYDTTPVCQTQGHIHTEACFTLNTVELNLPALTQTENLSISPDHFTVNLIGIPCNRIIDIRNSSGFNIDTSWKKY